MTKDECLDLEFYSKPGGKVHLRDGFNALCGVCVCWPGGGHPDDWVANALDGDPPVNCRDCRELASNAIQGAAQE